jgi:hypothetical protein
VERDLQAERIRSLVLMRATCDTVLHHLDEDDIDDLALAVQISELCDTLEAELRRFAHRRTGSTYC